MTMVDAIYKNGTFHPVNPVELPEDCHVRLSVETLEPTAQQLQAVDEIYQIMGRFLGTPSRLIARMRTNDLD